MNRKSILFIITNFDRNGAQVILYNILLKIDRSLFSPVVISLMNSSDFGDQFQELEIPMYALGMQQKLPNIDHLSELVSIIKKHQPDIIQGWMYHGNIASCFAYLFCSHSPPVIWSIHHSINELSAEKLLTRLLIRIGTIFSYSTRKIAYVSKTSKEQHEKLGYTSQKSCVIPNGFDTSLFTPSIERKKAFRAELNLSDEEIVIGIVARYHPMKDHHNFLAAAALLVPKFPDIHFVLVGDGVDESNTTLTQLVETSRLQKHVHLLGKRIDMPNIFSALDILTSASAYGEAFPLVVGEAMSCQVTCVVTDVGDSAFLVGDTGIVVPTKDPESLANAWSTLILRTPEDRLLMEEAARQRIIDSFSLESIVKQYESMYAG
ncbi:glycosyltransferase [Acaryochloris sp. 'Moss Beach']|uniref:glycosyltransferase n=1 Tax=Acaryochloris sp. 'Moss Beach' TaxID=2740837 RepID=UPI001F1E4256|nr:glycosyltransferase [Acaryochloris sp. 'Moss Beach']